MMHDCASVTLSSGAFRSLVLGEESVNRKMLCGAVCRHSGAQRCPRLDDDTADGSSTARVARHIEHSDVVPDFRSATADVEKRACAVSRSSCILSPIDPDDDEDLAWGNGEPRRHHSVRSYRGIDD